MPLCGCCGMPHLWVFVDLRRVSTPTSAGSVAHLATTLRPVLESILGHSRVFAQTSPSSVRCSRPDIPVALAEDSKRRRQGLNLHHFITGSPFQKIILNSSKCSPLPMV